MAPELGKINGRARVPCPAKLRRVNYRMIYVSDLMFVILLCVLLMGIDWLR